MHSTGTTQGVPPQRKILEDQLFGVKVVAGQ